MQKEGATQHLVRFSASCQAFICPRWEGVLQLLRAELAAAHAAKQPSQQLPQQHLQQLPRPQTPLGGVLPPPAMPLGGVQPPPAMPLGSVPPPPGIPPMAGYLTAMSQPVSTGLSAPTEPPLGKDPAHEQLALHQQVLGTACAQGPETQACPAC